LFLLELSSILGLGLKFNPPLKFQANLLCSEWLKAACIGHILEENEFLIWKACLPFIYLLLPPPHKRKIESVKKITDKMELKLTIKTTMEVN